MRTLLLFILLLLSTNGFAQQRFEDFAALRKQRGTIASWALVRFGVTPGDKLGGVFMWDSASVAVDDNKRVIGDPAWTKGRYVKSEPLTSARGTYTVSSMGIGTATYTIPHGLPVPPVILLYTFKSNNTISLGTPSWTADATNVYIRVPALAIIPEPVTITYAAYID